MLLGNSSTEDHVPGPNPVTHEEAVAVARQWGTTYYQACYAETAGAFNAVAHLVRSIMAKEGANADGPRTPQAGENLAAVDDSFKGCVIG